MIKKITIFAMLLVIVLAINTVVMASEWEKINWDKPVSMLERLTADKYILPEGWEEATKGVKEISFYNSGGLSGDIATAMNMELFKQKTGIELKAIPVSGDCFDKVFSALVTKNGSIPLLLLDSPAVQMSALSAQDRLGSLDHLYPPEIQELYSPGLKNLLYRNGHWWGSLEVNFNYGATYYRPSWLKKAGVEVPTTFQELFEAAKKVRAWASKNVDPNAYGLVFGASKTGLTSILQELVYSQGGNFYDGQYRFQGEETRNAVKYLADLCREDVISTEVVNYMLTDVGMAFGIGRAGFAFSLMTSYARKFETEFPVVKDDWAMLPPLKWDSDTPDKYGGAIISANVGVINKFSNENEQAVAMLYLDFLRSKEAQANEVIVEGNDTAIPQYYDSSLVKLVDWDLANSVADQLGITRPNKIEEFPYMEIRKAIVNYAKCEEFPANFPNIESEMCSQITQAMLGQITVDQAINSTQKYAEQF